jgi:hypothetical protein
MRLSSQRKRDANMSALLWIGMTTESRHMSVAGADRQTA